MKTQRRYDFEGLRLLHRANTTQLIRHTIANFNIAPDKAALSRVNDSLSTLQQSRDLRIRDDDTALRKLSRQLATVSSQHKEMISSHDSRLHAQEIIDLDTKKFRIAKQASEIEMESERLEVELHNLKGRLLELEDQGVEGDEVARRMREVDDPTMYAEYTFSHRDMLILVDCDYGCTGVWGLTWSKTRPGIITRLQSTTQRRVMFMWSTSTQNFQDGFIQTISGKQCEDDSMERFSAQCNECHLRGSLVMRFLSEPCR